MLPNPARLRLWCFPQALLSLKAAAAQPPCLLRPQELRPQTGSQPKTKPETCGQCSDRAPVSVVIIIASDNVKWSRHKWLTQVRSRCSLKTRGSTSQRRLVSRGACAWMRDHVHGGHTCVQCGVKRWLHGRKSSPLAVAGPGAAPASNRHQRGVHAPCSWGTEHAS